LKLLELELRKNIFMPEQWNNFFVMVGGGAAALAGLIFVAMSINHEIIFRNTTHEQLCKLGIENIVVHPGDIPYR
jgi:hypothetical protein